MVIEPQGWLHSRARGWRVPVAAGISGKGLIFMGRLGLTGRSGFIGRLGFIGMFRPTGVLGHSCPMSPLIGHYSRNPSPHSG